MTFGILMRDFHAYALQETVMALPSRKFFRHNLSLRDALLWTIQSATRSTIIILSMLLSLYSAFGSDQRTTSAAPTAKDVITAASSFVSAYLGPERASRLRAVEYGTIFNSDKRLWMTMFASGIVDDYVMVEMDETVTRANLWTFSGPVLRSDYKGPDSFLTLAEFRAALAKQK